MALMMKLSRVYILYIPLFIFLFSILHIFPVSGKLHTLELKNDVRNYFVLSSFGFYKNGYLDVNIKKFSMFPYDSTKVFGFTLDKTKNDAITPYLENHQDQCVLEDRERDDSTMSVIFFTMDLANKKLIINCSKSMESIHIGQSPSVEGNVRQARAAVSDKLSDNFLMHNLRRRQAEGPPDTETTGDQKALPSTTNKSQTPPIVNVVTQSKPKAEQPEDSKKHSTQQAETPLGIKCGNGLKFDITGDKEFETAFVVRILDPAEEGLYNLYFHNCPTYRHPGEPTAINLTVVITETNNENYLSAGEMPLPALYFTMSILFFLSGCFWIFILRKSSSGDVYKIHYLMGILVYLKSFSLMFHGVNYHFIQSFGYHIETWAVLYYITHLLKGALLFITIVLIGTGWAFIKHILSDKDKKIFMIVIPLQVLANVAEIIIEESEEGDSTHTTWREVFILVDLLCCGAILFPVVWSIRHLQEASQTDGKAAINLQKLKLFRHFYIMIVCYIYFTRIIVYLLRITVPFQYEWLDEMFREMAVFVFFVLTGYKFRPAGNNPYFQLPQDDDEIEMNEVLTQSGMMQNLSKVTRIKVAVSENNISSKRESSHEYD